MSNQNREVWITGIGLVSCFGEGAAHHWDIMGGDKAPANIVETELYAPYAPAPDARNGLVAANYAPW